jgi:hypothetical protein
MSVSQGMWQMVSNLLDGEKLPESMNQALEGLCNGTLTVTENTEPVAWIAIDAKLPLTEDGSYWLYPTEIVSGNSNYLPLYTTPQSKSIKYETVFDGERYTTRIKE